MPCVSCARVQVGVPLAGGHFGQKYKDLGDLSSVSEGSVCLWGQHSPDLSPGGIVGSRGALFGTLMGLSKDRRLGAGALASELGAFPFQSGEGGDLGILTVLG